tara:strand:- start:317 stop:517 length:201 start_codon:yes stop_codon:yes gene_type:complete
MSYFVVNYCKLRACQHWRIGNNCIKNETLIGDSIKYSADMHNSDICEVRKQIDKYRLEHMLEGEKV